MRRTGRVLRHGHTMIWVPGRHLAGDNTFAYFLDPHGTSVEYTQDQWGTSGELNELVTKQSFNDPDRGCFVAPPL